MENINELIGYQITFDEDIYYAFDIKEKDSNYFCLGLNINTKSFDEGAQILEVSLKNGELIAFKYKGEDYQSLLNEFMKPENLLRCLDLMEKQKEILSKENKEP